MKNLIRIVDKVVTYYFPEVESAKEIALNDMCWIASLPLIGVSLLTFVLSNIN